MRSRSIQRAQNRSAGYAHVVLRLVVALVVLLGVTQVVSLASSPSGAPARAGSPEGTGGLFHAAQGRLYDTSSGYGGYSSPQPAGTRTYSVVGRYGVPTTGIGAVAVTITALNPSNEGYLDATADPQPAGSSLVTTLDMYPGNSVTNSAIVPVGSNGNISIISQASTNLIIDLQGYFTKSDNGAAPGGYVPVTPSHVLYTSNNAVAAKGSVNVSVTGGSTGVPAGASAVFVNVLVVHQSFGGYINAYPTGGTPGTAYAFPDATYKAFGVETAVSAGGQITIANPSNTSLDLIVDVVGYFSATSSAGGAFTPWQTNVFDTRDSSHVALAANGVGTYRIAGVNQVPAPSEGVSAVSLNLIAIQNGGSNAYVTAWASDKAEPTGIATLYTKPGQAINAMAPITTGPDGTIKIRNKASVPIDLVLDVEGWFMTSPSAPSATGPACQLSGNRHGSKPVTHSLSDRSQLLLNPVNGNASLTGTLLHIKGIQQDVSVSWRYNAINDARPSLSVGRSEDALRPWSNGDFSYVAPDGGCYRFNQTSSNKWDAPPGINAKLSSPSSNKMTLRFDPGGVKNTYEQQADGLWVLTKSEDKNSDNPNTVSYAYAATGKLAQITDTQGRTVTFAYNDANNAGQPSTITDTSLNRTITLAYNGPFGALSKITDAAGDTTSFDYDSTGLVKLTDGRGDKTTFGYDGQSRLTSWTFGTGANEAAAWQAAYPSSDKTTITDPNNHTASYDLKGNLVSGTVQKVTDGLGHKTSMGWDAHDNETSQANDDGDASTMEYGGGSGNPNNLLSKVTSPNGAGSASGGASQSLTYPSTASGSQVDNEATTSTDGQGNKTALTWDKSTNQMSSSATTSVGGTSVGGKSSATYQGDDDKTDCSAKQGEMCSSTSGNGYKTTYSYDSSGNLTTLNPPAPLGNRTYTYDAAGRVSSQGDGRGNTAYYSYDGDDRITQVSYTAPNSSTPCQPATCVQYGYDNAGNKTSRVDASGTTTWVYDALNRVNMKKLNGTALSSATYDGASNQLTYTDGYGTVTYAYDAANLVRTLAEPGGSCPSGVTTPNTTGCTTFEYDKNNRRTAIHDANGVTVTTNYFHSSKVKTITTTKSDGSVIAKRVYHYGAFGSGDADLLSSMDNEDSSNNTTNYVYDGKDRLTSTTGVDAGSWDYDNDGNRTKATSGGSTTYSAYNKADELCFSGPTSGSDCANPPSDASGYASDLTGNQLDDKTSAGKVNNTYNVFNQATQTTVGVMNIPFSYADTTNTERLTAGTTNYSNGSAGLDAEATGAASTYFVRDPDGMLIAMHTAAGSNYYSLDALGSVIKLTDGNQTTVASYRYGPWGNQTSSGGALATLNPYRYASGYSDSQTGYLKFGARYYNTGIGRFVQPDPQSTWGGYTYADNDPINNTDPTGNNSVSDFFTHVAGAFTGAVTGAALGGKIGFFAGEAIDPFGGGAPGALIGTAVGAVFGAAYGASGGGGLDDGSPSLK